MRGGCDSPFPFPLPLPFPFPSPTTRMGGLGGEARSRDG